MCRSSSEGVHGDVRAKHDGEDIQRRPVSKRSKPRLSQSQELLLTAHGRIVETDYGHFEQNRDDESFLKNPLQYLGLSRPLARVI